MITLFIIGSLLGIIGGGSYFMIPNIEKRVKGLVGDPIRLAKLNGAILTAEDARLMEFRTDQDARLLHGEFENCLAGCLGAYVGQ